MNDDQIRSELERRASPTSSRPDWVTRDLLPAVRHDIDARPQRVMTSNWSPRLGAVAVVAALLIMVIALPRLAPQPPAATPSPSFSPAPGPDTVFLTADFAAGVASGLFDGRTLLVQGRISVPAVPDPVDYACNPPSGGCAMGALEGTNPLVYIVDEYKATTDTPGSGTWAGSDGGRDFHFPSVPIEGVLALRVLSVNHVFFVGLAGQSGAIPVLSVAQAQTLDISTVTTDQVVLVDGWLGGFTATRCLARPVPTIQLLPSRECSDEVVSRDPYPQPGSPLIQVQPGAYAQSAPNPTIRDGNVPRKGLYALAPRLEGWCQDSAPPCWEWNVAARVNGPPEVPVPTAPATIECTRSTGLPLNVVDDAGVIVDCRTLDNVSASDQPLVLNPDGNLSKLQVWFMANRCVTGADAQLSVGPGGYDLVITEGATVPGCAGPPIALGLDLSLRTDIAASTVTATLSSQPTPPPPPSPTPPVGTRVFSCEGSEALGDPGITLIDHSSRIGGCSIGQADFTPDAPLDVTTTRLPNQLAATWTVNAGCPADDQLELWGPIKQPVGLGEYVLRLARQQTQRFDPATCGDFSDTRQVEIVFTVEVNPTDILAISFNRSIADGTVSSSVSDGDFELQLAAAQDQTPNEPIDITSRLTYDGTDPVTLSGDWRPNFAFSPLTGGPTFDPYGGLLLCPDAEIGLSANEGVSGQLEGPITLDPTDPNYDYRTQYAYDGNLRLPMGAYLIYTGVSFNPASNCSGERVHLWGAIVIEVGLVNAQWNF